MVDKTRRESFRRIGLGLLTPFVISFSRRIGASAPAPLSPRSGSDPAVVFPQSVASGDPTESGVMLWTRIEPASLRPGEPLWFQVADDPGFRSLQIEGTVPADAIGPSQDHTVRVDLTGQLDSDRRYYYRFLYAGVASRAGRCRTLPSSFSHPAKLTVATICCHEYSSGYYAALRALAARDEVDLVLHLGDFIYERPRDLVLDEGSPYPDRQLTLPSGAGNALDLEDYRFLYRLYRTEPDLQRCQEQHTFVQIWDDHELANDCYWDYERDTLGAPDHPYTLDSQYGNDPALLRQLARDAMQAWQEYVPARVAVDPLASHPHDYFKINRSLRWGRLAELFVTDERSYRTPHPCGEGRLGQRHLSVDCPVTRDDQGSMLGPAQRDWLVSGLTGSPAQWKIWGNPVFFGELTVMRNFRRVPLSTDAWDGYPGERAYITEAIRDNGIDDFVVLTGDFHTYIASHIKVDYRNPANRLPSNTVGVEFMTTAVSSTNNVDRIALLLGQEQIDLATGAALGDKAVRSVNPHIALFDTAQHGYAITEFTPEACVWSAYVTDKTRSDPDRLDRLYRRYLVWAGRPYVERWPTWLHRNADA